MSCRLRLRERAAYADEGSRLAVRRLGVRECQQMMHEQLFCSGLSGLAAPAGWCENGLQTGLHNTVCGKPTFQRTVFNWFWDRIGYPRPVDAHETCCACSLNQSACATIHHILVRFCEDKRLLVHRTIDRMDTGIWTG